jgi:hypothetical protein
MRRRRTVLLVTVAIALPPAIPAQTPAVTAFIVPAHSDLAITKRYWHGDPSAVVSTEVLYLKRARERRELAVEAGHEVHRSITITQCDERRSFQLNPDTRLFGATALVDWS